MAYSSSHASNFEDAEGFLRLPWLEPSSAPAEFGLGASATPYPLEQRLEEFWQLVELSPTPLRWTTSVDWFVSELERGRHFRFADPRMFSLLRRFTMPAVERYRGGHVAFRNSFAPSTLELVPELTWRLDEPNANGDPYAASLRAIHPDRLPSIRQRNCAKWARPRAVLVSNWGSDYDRLPLVDCDGAIDLFALDRISVLARTQNAKNPGIPLPESPNPPAEWPDEWVDGVRLLHPRLLWVMQQLGEAYPRRAIQIMSGYRRDLRPNSVHRQGRAIDVQIRGVDNTELFGFCRSLKDVGCGFYPNHPFVHVDVRNSGGKAVLWVDVSKPGEPSQYVDAWPGVVESGAMAGADSE